MESSDESNSVTYMDRALELKDLVNSVWIPYCNDKFNPKIKKKVFWSGSKNYAGQKFVYSNEVYKLSSDIKYSDIEGIQNFPLNFSATRVKDGTNFNFRYVNSVCERLNEKGGGKRKSRKQKKSLKRKSRKARKSHKKRR